MERPSLEFNLPDTPEEGKLYVVDSLNNLNKLNVCPAESQLSLGKCTRFCGNMILWNNHINAPPYISAVKNDEEENTGGTGESMAESNARNQFLFFITFILTLTISLALVSFVIFLIFQTRNELDQISSRLLSEKKNIEELKKLNNIILKHLNQSRIKE
uniref:Leucine rich single-pass membrane protein 1 n=1 Tax=Taeniopygia guttata TaxID=59729 RepID=A0A674GHR7_TAEGU